MVIKFVQVNLVSLPYKFESRRDGDSAWVVADNKFALDQNEFAIMSNNISSACHSIIDKGIEYQDIESDTVNNYRGRWEPQDYKD